MFNLLLVIFIITAILLIPAILLQSGEGAQSGLMGGDSISGAFGAKSSEVMVKITTWLIIILFVSAFLLSYIKIRENKIFIEQPAQQTTETK